MTLFIIDISINGANNKLPDQTIYIWNVSELNLLCQESVNSILFLRVSDQSGISWLYVILEIYDFGRKPSFCSRLYLFTGGSSPPPVSSSFLCPCCLCSHHSLLFTMSSLQWHFGVPVDVMPLICYSVLLMVHLLSFILVMCQAHFHLAFVAFCICDKCLLLILYPVAWLTIGAPLKISQPASSTPHGSQLSVVMYSIQGQSTLWCCLPIVSSVCLFISLLELFPVGQSWPVLMIVWRARTTSVCIFSLKSGGLHTSRWHFRFWISQV